MADYLYSRWSVFYLQVPVVHIQRCVFFQVYDELGRSTINMFLDSGKKLYEVKHKICDLA